MMNSEADLSDVVAPSVVRLKPKMLEFPSPGTGALTEDTCPPKLETFLTRLQCGLLKFYLQEL